MPALLPHHAAEADLAGVGIDRFGLASRGSVAQAVGGCEVRAALDYASGDVRAGAGDVVARVRRLDAGFVGRPQQGLATVWVPAPRGE
jgi:hypothetical protein